MSRLQQSGLHKTLGIPILHGLVQYQQEADHICGLLLIYQAWSMDSVITNSIDCKL